MPFDPQPFAHLGAPNVALYRDVMRAFARAKERFIVHLRPEDVAAELGRDPEELAQALDQLVTWGNLRADPDTGRVTTVEDFHPAARSGCSWACSATRSPRGSPARTR